jgi:hypothetical protein
VAQDKSANRRAVARREPADGVEEALRQLDAGILSEPVPERLRRVLRPTPGPDQEPTSDAARGDTPDDPPERG